MHVQDRSRRYCVDGASGKNQGAMKEMPQALAIEGGWPDPSYEWLGQF